MAKRKHAILIDPFARTVGIVTYNDGNNSIKDWYSLLDCTCIDMLDIGQHPTDKRARLSLVCDDEGLYSKGNKQRFFRMKGNRQMLGGKCLLVATDAPDTIDLKDPDFLIDMINAFHLVDWQDERTRFRDISTMTEENVETAFGIFGTRITQTPHFSLASDEELAQERDQ